MEPQALHRYIVTSATYRQDYASPAVDAGNRLLAHEPAPVGGEMRDTMLVASGKLNRHLGGVGYRDVRVLVQGSNFYDIIAQDRSSSAAPSTASVRRCPTESAGPLTAPTPPPSLRTAPPPPRRCNPLR